jgi:hypothetical protein
MIKKKKMSLVLALATVLAAGICGLSSAFAAGMSDTSGHWAEGDILAGIDYGYISGYPDSTFKPDNTITRAEFVKVINRARNYSAMTNIPFKDVPVNEWYFQDVQIAYMAGYIKGDSENNFNPNAQITRQEAAEILNRIAPGGDASHNLAAVRDADKISDWALPAVRAVYSKGYITGDTDGNFNPQAPLKRGETVRIVNRVLGVSPLQPGANLAALSISNINVTGIDQNGATLNLTSTRNGNAYWVILTGSGATTPTADQILNGRASDNKSAYGSGNRSVFENTAIAATLSSLQSEQSYKICAVARDAANNLSPVAIFTFTTSSAGDTGEEWLNNNFSVSNVGNNSVTLTVNSSRAGYLYYVIVEEPDKDAKTPSQVYIKNGKDANNSTAYRSDYFSISAGANKSVDITDLKAGTNYRIFGCVYESTSSNSLYSTVKNRAFTTTGTNADWLTTFEIQSNSITATGATLSVRADRDGTFYYVVSESSTYPTATQIRNGRDYNEYSVLSGNFTVSSNTSNTRELTGLTTNKRYYVFGALYAGGNWSNIKRVDFTPNTGTVAARLSNVSYSTNTSPSAMTIFDANSSTYSDTIDLKGSGDNVTINVTKTSGTTVSMTIGSRKAETIAGSNTTDSRTITTSDAEFASSSTIVVRLTVVQSGKTDLVYTINIKK